MKDHILVQGEIIKKLQNALMNLNIFSRTAGPISTKFGTKRFWMNGFNVQQIRTSQFLRKEIIISCPNVFIDWNCLSDKRCGPYGFLFCRCFFLFSLVFFA